MPATAEIPLFPLRTVLVPGGFLPLRIFERRYLDMVREVAREGSGFGVCLLLSDPSGQDTLQHARTGTLARIRDFYTLADGLLGISAEGGDRFQVQHTRFRDNGLLLGQVEWLDEAPGQAVPEACAVLSQIVARFMEELGQNYPDFRPSLLQDAAWVGYRLTELLPLDETEKQALLELNDPGDRLHALLELIPRFQKEPPGE